MCDRNYDDAIGSAGTKYENILKSLYSNESIWTRHSRQGFRRFHYAAHCVIDRILKPLRTIWRSLCVILECLFELLIGQVMKLDISGH
jgi:hypothetical protein